MKKLLALCCLLAACELQPAPKQAPPAASSAPAGSAASVAVAPATGSAAAGPAGGIAVAPAAGSAAGSGARVVPPPPPAVQVTADCEKAAVRYAELFIAGAPESQRGIYEQDRANMVRRTEVACSQQAWTAPALACIAQAKTDRDARACLDKFPPAGTKRPATQYHPPRD
ncbi:MAG TPA: hypothetical protein VLT45_21840 [Kofleriaceae bacterium]|nr:hypothetical protein [Kofleriaceae bacterium]